MTATLQQVVSKIIPEHRKKFTSVFRETLQDAIKTRLIPDVEAKFLAAYDKLAEQEAAETPLALIGEDPTFLQKWRGLFLKDLRQQLSGAGFGPSQIEVAINEAALFGDGNAHRDSTPTSVDWLVYYVEGMIGEYAFISETLYEKMRGSSPTRSLGRFGEGFLMSKEAFENERWEKGTGMSFQQLRHPISGQRPYRDFEKIADTIDPSPLIQNAVELAAEAIGLLI